MHIIRDLVSNKTFVSSNARYDDFQQFLAGKAPFSEASIEDLEFYWNNEHDEELLKARDLTWKDGLTLEVRDGLGEVDAEIPVIKYDYPYAKTEDGQEYLVELDARGQERHVYLKPPI